LVSFGSALLEYKNMDPKGDQFICRDCTLDKYSIAEYIGSLWKKLIKIEVIFHYKIWEYLTPAVWQFINGEGGQHWDTGNYGTEQISSVFY